MTKIKIRDWELGEVVGVVDDNGTYEAGSPLAEEVLSILTDGPAQFLTGEPTDDGEFAEIQLDVEPGEVGYLYAILDSLPAPLEAEDPPELEPPIVPTVTTLAETPFSEEELGIALERKSDERGDYFHDVESKTKVYIDDPTDAPEGAKVQTGPADGTFYNTDDVEGFRAAMDSIEERVKEQFDFTDDQWSEARSLESEYRNKSEELFGSIVEASGMPGNTKATHRVKSPSSMLEKVFERDDASARSLDDLDDVFGAKFVPSNIDEVRSTANNLANNLSDRLDLASIDVDDRLDPDEDTYYRAVHIDFETEDGLSGEIQVKSEEMEELIAVGHDTVFKNNAGLDEGVLDEVDDCLTAQMDALFGEDADPDASCTEAARTAIRQVA